MKQFSVRTRTRRLRNSRNSHYYCIVFGPNWGTEMLLRLTASNLRCSQETRAITSQTFCLPPSLLPRHMTTFPKASPAERITYQYE